MNKLENRKALVGIIIAALFILNGAFMLVAVSDKQRNTAARSALANCQQIELVKVEIRKTLERSLVTIPTLAYYRTHDDERIRALKETNATLVRFAPKDCYQLPTVKQANLHYSHN